MEVTDGPDQANQTESVKETSAENSPAVKSTPVSVIQPPSAISPAKVNGTSTEAEPVTPAEAEQPAVNGVGANKPAETAAEEPNKDVEVTEQAQQEAEPAQDSGALDIQQPSEELPAQLLQGDNSNTGVTTVGSLIEEAAKEPEPVEAAAVPEPAAEVAAPETPAAKAPASVPVTPAAKPTATDLAAEWEDDGGDVEMKEVDSVPASAPAAADASSDNKEETDENESSPRKSGRKVKPTEKVLEGDNYIEESVEAIANELANSAKKPPKEAEEKLDAAAASAKKAGRPKKKDLDEKVDNVTKLGNNMYFYTGPGGQDSPPPLNSDDEGEGGQGSAKTKETPAVEAARKSNRAGKGRNPRLEREDEEVEIPKKLPPKPNLNPSWLKDAAKAAGGVAAAKLSPAKKKVAETPGTPQAEAVPKADQAVPNPPEANATEEDTSEREATPPKDEELPEFDPTKFTKGYVPKTVKKGEDEYVVIVQGVQDTGLCGKYWGDTTNLPSRRRSKAPEPFKAGDSPDRVRRGSSGSTGSSNPGEGTPIKPLVATPKEQPATPNPQKSTKKQITKPETPKAAASPAPAAATNGTPAATPADAATATPGSEPEKKKRGRKRKVDTPIKEEEDKKLKQESKTPDKAGINKAAVTQALAAGSPAGQQRSVSCVSDTSTQKEVVVECFAPYDDHRWVNIGKERDGMTPDAVQYARALRPPYHLLSFLRIKGHSTKGMSCTDKNTMVFVVLEGEITVILHTTQFNAKKGDSFYIPPKNYYNLINQKAREAELSLIQFQYDGPLPTVNTTAPTPATPTASTTPAQ